ncbi:MAG TPA: S8 family serine peptidase, partial [Saprospiraceae bacterium]|nr:S8 family serine peptidase [Saprospiraceae bacterium]
SLAFSEATLTYKLLVLFRDLAILGVLSQAFSYIRKHAIVLLVAAILVYGMIQFFGFRVLYNTFPQVAVGDEPLDDTYELLVETKDGKVPDSYQKIIDQYHLTTKPAFTAADPALSHLDEFIEIGIPDQSEKKIKKIIREIRKLSGTEYIELNEVVTLDDPQEQENIPSIQAKYVNDPMVSQQWGWDAIQGDQVHQRLTGGIRPRKQVLIAILDTGVDAGHEDLRGAFRSTGTNNDNDPVGHGTHCAGIAAGVSNNGVGIASLIPDSNFVRVTSIKVLNASGIGSQQSTIQGIITAADMGADVISLSLGSPSSDLRQRAYDEAVRYANAKGAIVVAAAGNSNKNSKQYSPANAKGIIAVSAMDVNEHKAPFSNTVEDIDYAIAAPGVKIMSTFPNGQYKELNGTSMATPMVAGLIGLLKSLRPDLNTADAYNILNESGKNIPDGKKTGRLIQGEAALEKVMD